MAASRLSRWWFGPRSKYSCPSERRMLSFPLARAPAAAPSETTGLLSSYLRMFDYTLMESKSRPFQQ